MPTMDISEHEKKIKLIESISYRCSSDDTSCEKKFKINSKGRSNEKVKLVLFIHIFCVVVIRIEFYTI